jgi:hypothetical protein
LVCGLPNIELSENALQGRSGVLSARGIIASKLPSASMQYLLGSRLFIDSGQHQVKFYPDDLLPFLAAKRLSGLVKSPDHAQLLLDNFCWKAPTGECGVYRELLALAGWLSVFSAHCRKVLLEIEPQAVAFFGDLRNPVVSLQEATIALERSFKRLVEDGDSLGRRYFTLTTENYWQVMKTGIGPVLVRLYQQYGADINARDVLLDIAANAKSKIFRETVLDEVGRDYDKLLADQLGLNYILGLGVQNDFDSIAVALLKQPALSENLISTVVSQIAWRSLSAKTISFLLIQQFGRGRGGYSLDWAVTGIVAENASDSELYSLIRSLTLHLINRGIKYGQTPEEFRSDQKFVELVLNLLAVLMWRSSVSLTKTVFLCHVLNRFMVNTHSGNVDLRQLRSALNGNKVVRLAFLKGLISTTDGTSAGIEEVVFAYHSLYQLVEDDELELNEPGFTEIVERRKAFALNQKKTPFPGRSKQIVVDKSVKQELVAKLEGGFKLEVQPCVRAIVSEP